MRIKKVEALVYKALVDQPITRSDDHILILEVLKNYVTPNLSLEAVLMQHTLLGVPSFESITRARRKLQEQDATLVNVEARKIRREEEKEYIQYALNIE